MNSHGWVCSAVSLRRPAMEYTAKYINPETAEWQSPCIYYSSAVSSCNMGVELFTFLSYCGH